MYHHIFSQHLYNDFTRLLFLHAHREASALANELPEESDQFRFLRKGTVGLIMTKTSAMRISIPLDLSSRPFVPLQRFIRSGRPTPLLAPSLVGSLSSIRSSSSSPFLLLLVQVVLPCPPPAHDPSQGVCTCISCISRVCVYMKRAHISTHVATQAVTSFTPSADNLVSIAL